MRRKTLTFAALVLAAAGMAYSAYQLSDPVAVRAKEPKCCISDKACGPGGTCGTHNCDGLHGGAC